jgi:cob(I)alamin adenosyltransferase
MKVYTKTGDKGSTSLLGGTRVSKADARLNTYGTIDELNAYTGLLRDQEVNAGRKPVLAEIQDRLFTIGALLAVDERYPKAKLPQLHADDISFLEKEIDAMDEKLQPMRSFVLPGGHQSVSFCHISRCVCRRAERLVIDLAEKQPVHGYEMIVQYLNRLSDYLFVLARAMSSELNAEEIPWKPRM